jgi:hypothetical protein
VWVVQVGAHARRARARAALRPGRAIHPRRVSQQCAGRCVPRRVETGKRDRWVTLRARWVTLRARWVTLRARWVTLRARWVTLRARWVTLRARCVPRRLETGPHDAGPVQQLVRDAAAPVHRAPRGAMEHPQRRGQTGGVTALSPCGVVEAEAESGLLAPPKPS